MSIQFRLTGFVVLGLLCLLLIGGTSLINSNRITDALGASTTATAMLRNHMDADMMHDALRADVLAAIVAGRAQKANERKNIEKDLNEHLQLFRQAMSANATLPLPGPITQALRRVEPVSAAYLQESSRLVALSFDHPDQIDANLGKFMDSFRLLENEMEAISDLVEKFSAETNQLAQNNARGFGKIISVIIAIATICFVAIAWFTISNIRNNIKSVFDAIDHLNTGTADLAYRLPPLQGEFSRISRALNQFLDTLSGIIGNVGNASDSIASAAEQIAGGTADLAERTTTQARSLAQTTQAMEELIATVNQNADNAGTANKLARTASEVASKGGSEVSQVVATMGSINESAKKIVDIISVIDGIAFQTNILALNAAVEAARAGEQGRGFAVVATEVRNLAQRSASAAREIKTLISDSVEKVDTGAALVDNAGATMERVVASVREVTDLISQITQASQEQISGLALINDAIVALENSTHQNAALVEESAAATGSLSDQAAGLSQITQVFKGGQATKPTTKPAKTGAAPHLKLRH